MGEALERREYKVDEITVGPVRLKVLRLVGSSKVDENKALEDMEVGDYKRGTYVELVSTVVDKQFGHAKKKIIAYGKGLGKLEISKWPKKLIAIGVVRERKEKVSQSDVEWYNVNEDVYVFEGDVKVEGNWALLLLTLEDGTVVLTPNDLKQTRRKVVKKDEGEKKRKKRKSKS